MQATGQIPKTGGERPHKMRSPETPLVATEVAGLHNAEIT
jgi:hypothetical protein